jgi:hypothetical protein
MHAQQKQQHQCLNSSKPQKIHSENFKQNIFDDYILLQNRTMHSVTKYDRPRSKSAKDLSSVDQKPTTTITSTENTSFSQTRPKSFHEEDFEQYQYYNYNNNKYQKPHQSYVNKNEFQKQNNSKFNKLQDETKVNSKQLPQEIPRRYSTIRTQRNGAANNNNYEKYQYNGKGNQEKYYNNNQMQQSTVILKQPVPIFNQSAYYGMNNNSSWKVPQNNRNLVNRVQMASHNTHYYPQVQLAFNQNFPNHLAFRMTSPSESPQYFGYIPTTDYINQFEAKSLTDLRLVANKLFYAPPSNLPTVIPPIQPRQSKAIPIINPEVKTSFFFLYIYVYLNKFFV